MKIVAVGDAFITPEMMKEGHRKSSFSNEEITILSFGSSNRSEMRDIVRTIEHRELDRLTLPEGYLEAVSDAEILMVHLCPVTREVISAAKNLKYILCNRGGVENIDVEAANERGIVILHNPAHNANAVAEFAIGVMLCETRNIARACEALKNDCWRESYPNTATTIHEMRDMTVGIIGFGSVGRLVAEKLEPFHSKILVFDPFLDPNAFDLLNVEFVELDELMRRSDIVTIHARGSSPVIDAAAIAKMKPTSYVINTARACLIDNVALTDALRNHRIMGAALDVFETEPSIPEMYRGIDNITITNHRGGDTINSYSDSPEMMYANLRKMIDGRRPLFWLNKEAISHR